jgi:hypothetical protein
MKVDSNERRQSSDIKASNAQHPSTDATEYQEPPFTFKMAQELIFSMLAHTLQSTHDSPNPYVTILLTFLQSVLQKPEGFASLEHLFKCGFWDDNENWLMKMDS